MKQRTIIYIAIGVVILIAIYFLTKKKTGTSTTKLLAGAAPVGGAPVGGSTSPGRPGFANPVVTRQNPNQYQPSVTCASVQDQISTLLSQYSSNGCQATQYSLPPISNPNGSITIKIANSNPSCQSSLNQVENFSNEYHSMGCGIAQRTFYVR